MEGEAGAPVSKEEGHILKKIYPKIKDFLRPEGIKVFDEPTSSLDLAHPHRMLSVARQCAAEGAGVLVILHDLNLAAQYADRIAVLHHGKLAADGTPDCVLTPDVLDAVFQVTTCVFRHPGLPCPLIGAFGKHRIAQANIPLEVE